MYVHIYRYIYIIYTYVLYVNSCIDIWLNVKMFIFAYVITCIQTYIPCKHACLHACMHTHRDTSE